MRKPVYDDEPMYVISVAARLVDMHPQTLRYYERAGLMKPTRSNGRIRLYSQRDVERLRKIARLTSELGVNLAGVEIIIDLTEKLERLQTQLRDLTGHELGDWSEIIDAHPFQDVQANAKEIKATRSESDRRTSSPTGLRRKR